MAWVVQAFFASVLLDIVNVVFICYAMDKDTHSVTNPEVHEVFSQVRISACAAVIKRTVYRLFTALQVFRDAVTIAVPSRQTLCYEHHAADQCRLIRINAGCTCTAQEQVLFVCCSPQVLPG